MHICGCHLARCTIHNPDFPYFSLFPKKIFSLEYTKPDFYCFWSSNLRMMLAKLASIIPESHSINHNFVQSSSYPSNWSEYFCNFWSIFYEESPHNFFYQNLKLSIDIRNEVRVTFDFVETCNGLMLNTDNYTPELFSLTMTVTKEGKNFYSQMHL